MENKKLSNIQLELLKIFSFELTEQELLELKEVLVKFFAEKITSGADKIYEKNNWSEAEIENILREHNRLKYE